jgi:hypothetical protein
MTSSDKREKKEALKNNPLLKNLNADDNEIKEKVYKAMKVIEEN